MTGLTIHWDGENMINSEIIGLKFRKPYNRIDDLLKIEY